MTDQAAIARAEQVLKQREEDFFGIIMKEAAEFWSSNAQTADSMALEACCQALERAVHWLSSEPPLENVVRLLLGYNKPADRERSITFDQLFTLLLRFGPISSFRHKVMSLCKVKEEVEAKGQERESTAAVAVALVDWFHPADDRKRAEAYVREHVTDIIVRPASLGNGLLAATHMEHHSPIHILLTNGTAGYSRLRSSRLDCIPFVYADLPRLLQSDFIENPWLPTKLTTQVVVCRRL
jgi:hypothetical protein